MLDIFIVSSVHPTLPIHSVITLLIFLDLSVGWYIRYTYVLQTEGDDIADGRIVAAAP